MLPYKCNRRRIHLGSSHKNFLCSFLFISSSLKSVTVLHWCANQFALFRYYLQFLCPFPLSYHTYSVLVHLSTVIKIGKKASISSDSADSSLYNHRYAVSYNKFFFYIQSLVCSCSNWTYTVYKSPKAFFCFLLKYWAQYVIQNTDDTNTNTHVTVTYQCCVFTCFPVYFCSLVAVWSSLDQPALLKTPLL